MLAIFNSLCCILKETADEWYGLKMFRMTFALFLTESNAEKCLKIKQD